MAAPADPRELVRSVTRAVVARLGHAGPQVVEAVVSEVIAEVERASGGAASSSRPPAPTPATAPFTTPRGASLLLMAGDGKNPPAFDYCMACVDQERARDRHRAVFTTTGRNTKGIVARVTARIADLGGDILDISQTLIGDFFTMIIVIDVGSLAVPFSQFQEQLQSTVVEMGCQAMVMHEDVMASLHRV